MWWTTFYDDLYADLALTGDQDTSYTRMQSLSALVGADAPSRWFDQCCGVGRWGLALANMGHEVEGVDLMASYVDRAKEDALKMGLAKRCTFWEGDALEALPHELCDVAMNWHTSFGYFEEDARNIQMLAQLWRALKPGGKAVLECGNAARTLANFEPTLTRVQQLHGEEVTTERRCHVDVQAGMMVQRWTITSPAHQTREHDTSLKLYMPWQLKVMFETLGFEDIHLYADEAGTPLDHMHYRCLIVATKPHTPPTL